MNLSVKGKFTYLIIMFLVFGGLNTTFAQEPLSLENAIERGLSANFQVRIAEANQKISAQNNSWVVAGKYPTINATLQNANGYNNINNPASFLRELSSLSTGITPGVELSWVLYNGKRIEVVKSQLESLEDQSKINTQTAIENGVQSIINAYFNVVVQKTQLEVNREVLALSGDRRSFQELQRSFGQSGTFEELQTKDAWFVDSTAFLVQQNNYSTSLRTLNSLMGEEDLKKEYLLTDQLSEEAIPLNEEALQQQLLARNSSFQLLQANKSLALINTQIQMTSLKPTLSLRSGLNYNFNLSSGTGTLQSGETLSLDAVTGQTTNGFINLAASFTLFDGGLRRKNIDAAVIQESIADFNLADASRNLKLQLSNLINNYNHQLQLYKISKELLVNAMENMKIAQERLEGGLINSFDYRAVQLAYLAANQQQLTTSLNIKNIETEILKLTGGLIN
ncbi:MAG: TolC family protein [Saprospiraceae bacterium]|jgi:outer membrane protein TolC